MLAAGVYLSYSRGALAVALLGLLVLAAAAPSRLQIRAAAVVLGTGVLVAAAAELLPGVSELAGDDAARDGLVFLAVLAAAGAAAALATARAPQEPDRPPRWYRLLGRTAWVAAAAVAVGLVIGGIAERPTDEQLAAGGPQRLTTVSSNRYEYWRVALNAFRDAPLIGAGSGGFRVAWLQERKIRETVRDTHSLEFEVLAELGLVGLLALALLAGGTAAAARRALASDRRALAAGPLAALVVWALHASIDWDWQIPAVTLPAIVLAGLLISLAEDAPR